MTKVMKADNFRGRRTRGNTFNALGNFIFFGAERIGGRLYKYAHVFPLLLLWK